MFANPTDEHENLNPMNSCLSWTKLTLTSQWSHPQGLISCWTRVSKFFQFLGYQVFDQLPEPGIGTSKIVPDSFSTQNCYLTTSSSHKGVILDTKALVGTKGRGLVVTYFFLHSQSAHLIPSVVAWRQMARLGLIFPTTLCRGRDSNS